MDAHMDVNWNLRTTVVNGMEMPIKECGGDKKFKYWSFVLDDMEKHLQYLKEDFVVREDDVFICTFPRSGTRWTHELVYMLSHGTSDFAPVFTFVENFPPEILEKMESPRILCTHLPLRVLPPKITKMAKIICVFRNPKDVAVSLHNLCLNLNFVDYKGPWERYLQWFVDGEVPCGTWFDHVQDWERAIKEHNTAPILTLYYEEMKSSLHKQVVKIANFLGIKENSELILKIANKCEFQTQYKERTTNVNELVKKLAKNTPDPFYRKGEVGDWKNWFTVAQNEWFDKVYSERMKNSTLRIKFSV